MTDQLNKDDQDWLDLLAGKHVPDAHGDTIREAQALRLAAALQKEEEKIDEAGFQRVVSRLRAADALPVKERKASQSVYTVKIQEFLRGLFERKYLARTASLALYTVFVIMVTISFPRLFDEHESKPFTPQTNKYVKKSETTPFIRQSMDPEKEAENLILELREIGVEPKLMVTAEIFPEKLSSIQKKQLTALLDKHDLQVLKNSLAVQFHPSPAGPQTTKFKRSDPSSSGKKLEQELRNLSLKFKRSDLPDNGVQFDIVLPDKPSPEERREMQKLLKSKYNIKLDAAFRSNNRHVRIIFQKRKPESNAN